MGNQLLHIKAVAIVIFLVTAALAGHIGFWIHWFNRINATGLKRTSIKKIEKVCVLLCFAIPIAMLIIDQRAWCSLFDWNAANGLRNFAANASWISWMTLAVAAAYLLIALPGYLESRFELRTPLNNVTLVDSRIIDVQADLGREELYLTPMLRFYSSLPWNEIGTVEVLDEEVQMAQLPDVLDGLKIGHLSDIHLTGWMHHGYYVRAVDAVAEAGCDLCILSGDLIDFDRCLPLVQSLLKSIQTRYGNYFVLGNHDRRLKDVVELRKLITSLGWWDLGMHSKSIDIQGHHVYLVGNEKPWFDPPERASDERATENLRSAAALRIGVSHSPDQLAWARSLGTELLFCGHNHGGQVQLPFLGPIVAPSWSGTRYASGWFERSPTMMRVSRGLSGTQGLRFRSRPEVAVITLRKKPSM